MGARSRAPGCDDAERPQEEPTQPVHANSEPEPAREAVAEVSVRPEHTEAHHADGDGAEGLDRDPRPERSLAEREHPAERDRAQSRQEDDGHEVSSSCKI